MFDSPCPVRRWETALSCYHAGQEQHDREERGEIPAIRHEPFARVVESFVVRQLKPVCQLKRWHREQYECRGQSERSQPVIRGPGGMLRLRLARPVLSRWREPTTSAAQLLPAREGRVLPRDPAAPCDATAAWSWPLFLSPTLAERVTLCNRDHHPGNFEVAWRFPIAVLCQAGDLTHSPVNLAVLSPKRSSSRPLQSMRLRNRLHMRRLGALR